MDHLRETYSELIAHMINAGYSENYVQTVRQEITLILKNADKWESYEELEDYHKQTASSYKCFSKWKAVLNIVASFDVYGTLPRSSAGGNHYFARTGSYHKLNSSFKGLIDHYRANTACHMKKACTVSNECNNASAFLLHLQETGYHSLESITEDAVIACLTDEDGAPSKSASYTDQIVAVFRGTVAYSPECSRILHYIPVSRKHRKNIQCFSPHERENIREALRDMSNGLTLRNRAIGYLLYYTGLRCCDISNLTLGDIDWENDVISICQQKTDIPLTLPMAAVVGNAIYDYISCERGRSHETYLFLSCRYPYGKLQPASVWPVADKIYKCADIRKEEGDRRGAHLFRHNFATAMLENGASRAVISKALGHASPDSSETYLSADMVHLKECALSIEAFPVRKGVFTNERF